jgi:PncC family amidohydrolase
VTGQARHDELLRDLHSMLAARGASVAVAESLTGGLLGAALTETPGSSETFRGGVLAYTTALKVQLLGVDPDLLDREGAVHPEVVRAMARGVRERLATTYGLATTGVAGPDPLDGQPPGTVYVGLAGPDGEQVGSHTWSGLDRAGVRREAVAAALALLRVALAGPAVDNGNARR